MAKFTFVAVPLIKLERTPTYSGRQLEIMSRDTVRDTFEAKSVDEAAVQFAGLCNALGTKDSDRSWHAWCETARGERAPRGFRAAKDGNAFNSDINPDRVTVTRDAA